MDEDGAATADHKDDVIVPNGEKKGITTGKGAANNKTLNHAPGSSEKDGAFIYPTKESSDCEIVAKKALTALSEATARNAVVGSPLKRTGAFEGKESSRFTSEPSHKNDESGDLPTNDDHVSVSGSVI